MFFYIYYYSEAIVRKQSNIISLEIHFKNPEAIFLNHFINNIITHDADDDDDAERQETGVMVKNIVHRKYRTPFISTVTNTHKYTDFICLQSFSMLVLS